MGGRENELYALYALSDARGLIVYVLNNYYHISREE